MRGAERNRKEKGMAWSRDSRRGRGRRERGGEVGAGLGSESVQETLRLLVSLRNPVVYVIFCSACSKLERLLWYPSKYTYVNGSAWLPWGGMAIDREIDRKTNITERTGRLTGG